MLVACANDPEVILSDAGGSDSATGDAGATDSGAQDAAAMNDSAVPADGGHDAGPLEAATPVDLGNTSDAATFDAGDPDMGTSIDDAGIDGGSVTVTCGYQDVYGEG